MSPNPPRGQMGEPMESILVLVDPMAPRTSRFLMRNSTVYKMLASVTLCRDLYMFHSEMTLSMHVHALVRAAREYVDTWSGAYFDLCLRILYSLRRFLLGFDGKSVPEKLNALFRRWWVDWESVTRSPEDDCSHPYVLPVLLAVLDDSMPTTQEQLRQKGVMPFTNYLNECAARQARLCLKGTSDAVDTSEAGRTLARRWMGINETNCPLPKSDVLEAEPPVEEIMAHCAPYVTQTDLNDAVIHQGLLRNDANTAVHVLPLFMRDAIILYKLCSTVRDFVCGQYSGSWDGFAADIEHHGGTPPSAEGIANSLKALNPAGICSELQHQLCGPAASPSEVRHVFDAVILQALLYHETKNRASVIVQQDVRDPVTLRDLIVTLRMSVYLTAAKVKQDQFAAIIGDVMYAEATRTDACGVARLIGTHTHGHSRSVFYSILKGCLGDTEKMETFLAHSNSCFRKKYNQRK